MTDPIPYGYCHCGCGEETQRAKQRHGSGQFAYRKGDPHLYRLGHWTRSKGKRRGWKIYPDDYKVVDMGFSTPCWLSHRGRTTAGYSQIRIDGVLTLAHIVAWAWRHGDRPPNGMHLDHLCRVRNCINPDHLEPVTRRENVRRGAWYKLSDDDVAAIRASTERSGVLAERYGISKGYVQQLRSGIAMRLRR